MVEGLLPSSLPTVSGMDSFDDSFEIPLGNRVSVASFNRRSLLARQSRLSRQMNDKEFYAKHINEIVTRDEKIQSLMNLVSQCKDASDIGKVREMISAFENSQGVSVESVVELQQKLEFVIKENSEMEIVIGELSGRVDLLTTLVDERENGDAEAERMKDKISSQQERIHQLEEEANALKAVISNLKDREFVKASEKVAQIEM